MYFCHEQQQNSKFKRKIMESEFPGHMDIYTSTRWPKYQFYKIQCSILKGVPLQKTGLTD